jgi:CRP-like cAMP-binding protein
MPIVSCASCPCGQAAGVATGGRCPLIDRRVPKGQTLALEGDDASTVWFVKHGAVLLSRSDRPRAVRGPGSFVGIETLVTGRHADTARTTEPSTLCAIPRDQLDRWLGGSPARMILEQVLAAPDELPAGARPEGSAVQRVARWLLDRRDRPAVRRNVLASLLGMVPETLSRTLARLRDAGAIAYTRRAVRILDVERLHALAGKAP